MMMVVNNLANRCEALAGRGIVITRPARQAERLARLVRDAGGTVFLVPAIEIAPIADPRPLEDIVARLDQFDLAVFVSPNAVEHAFAAIRAVTTFLPRLVVAAVGGGTVDALEREGVSNVVAPARFDSEALLDLPELREVSGKRVVIFRGEGGRELLAETLRRRGAQLQYAECYRRVRPRFDPAALLSAWAAGEVHAVTVTSSEGLGNLFAMLGAEGKRWLQTTPLFVPHPRIAQAAQDFGINQIVTTAQGDDGILQGLCAFFRQRD
jgi:uroporphyrinogen-III synthase